MVKTKVEGTCCKALTHIPILLEGKKYHSVHIPGTEATQQYQQNVYAGFSRKIRVLGKYDGFTLPYVNFMFMHGNIVLCQSEKVCPALPCSLLFVVVVKYTEYIFQ